MQITLTTQWYDKNSIFKNWAKNWKDLSQGKTYESKKVKVVSQLCPTLCDPMDHSTPGLPVHHQLPESTQTHLHWVSDAIQPSRPLSSTSPPAFKFPSIRVFSNESTLRMRWPKYWSFSFNISPTNEHPGLISFMMDWLDLLAVQGTLKSILQHYSSKASILQCSAFFIVQLSFPYMTTRKTIAVTRWTFVGKRMSLLLNMLSRLVITFLPRSKHLLISYTHTHTHTHTLHLENEERQNHTCWDRKESAHHLSDRYSKKCVHHNNPTYSDSTPIST